MIRYRKCAISLVITALLAGSAIAQYRQGRSRREVNRADYPVWEIDREFEHDVFTFVRIQYTSGYGGGRGGGWRNDYPDCDLNFSFRLQELTSIEVDPNGKVLRLTDPELTDFPFIYMSNVGAMLLSEEEMTSLRQYLLGGGFLMADDFWTPRQWRHVAREMEKVLPNRKPVDLPLSHPIFHTVYDLKEKPQVPSIFAWRDGYTFEYWHGDSEGDEEPHFQGYLDDYGRLMAIFCHNNDIGDGWEREGENSDYFRDYSEKKSYPMGINIVSHAMTH